MSDSTFSILFFSSDKKLMEKSQEFRNRIESQMNGNNEHSLSTSQDHIRNLISTMSEREQKLSDLATMQHRIFVWRVQFVRLDREWNEVCRFF